VCKKCNENDELITLNEWKNGINGFIEDIKWEKIIICFLKN
jgi:hypothetical protein